MLEVTFSKNISIKEAERQSCNLVKLDGWRLKQDVTLLCCYIDCSSEEILSTTLLYFIQISRRSNPNIATVPFWYKW